MASSAGHGLGAGIIHIRPIERFRMSIADLGRWLNGQTPRRQGVAAASLRSDPPRITRRHITNPSPLKWTGYSVAPGDLMNRSIAISLLAIEAALIAGYHAWRFLRYLAEPPQPKRSEVYRVENPSTTNGGGEYRLRFLR